MFELEQSIAEWRRQMLTAGITTPAPLEELEIHLREDVERQAQSGLDAPQAFENSVRQIGHANQLKSEFQKTCGPDCNAWLWFGGFGLVGTTIQNLAGWFVFHRSSSVFLSHQWWSDWLPNYVVWTSFILIGVSTGFSNWRSKRKATRQ